MNARHVIVATILLGGCAASVPVRGPGPAAILPSSVAAFDVRSGAHLDVEALLRRLDAADIVLLGEVHDNATHHAVRGQLIAGSARRPAVVFEQFAESGNPIPPPEQGRATDEWLDRNGFDRASWNWPVHQPVIDAAIVHAQAIWGSGIGRESLRSVVRDGEAAAPAHLRELLEAAPLDSAARAALDHELDVGHCGQLPSAMLPGMRAAQTVRDAAMTRALLRARESGDGPAWLIAGNGHVRRDIAVPRMLRAVAPGLDVVAVGLLERTTPAGDAIDVADAPYDIVILTPASPRPDPCASFRAR